VRNSSTSSRLSFDHNGAAGRKAAPTYRDKGADMNDNDFAKIAEDLETALLDGATTVAILGATPTALRVIARLAATGLDTCIGGIYTDQPAVPPLRIPVRPLRQLRHDLVDVVVVADDENKEELLGAALLHLDSTAKVIVAGYGHLKYRDPVYLQELAGLLVPSLANGYPNTLPHLHQCLANAARLGLRGVVAESGMFKGGTTMFLSRLIERLGADWPVVGFDTFDGFPPRRSPLDMYDHPDCVFTDLAAVRRYLADRAVEIVPGDIVTTARRLVDEDLVCTFIDTDNYTSARAAIEVVHERTLVGGAIVFDHFTGVDRFRYTLGERIAALPLLDDQRYFHLHGTGVFYRQR
jgi:O-methyltransferase